MTRPPVKLQDLPPKAARFCLRMERFVTGELGLNLAGKTVVAGYSGGADSTALLLALNYLSPRLGITLAAAHLDHGLRPESGAEAERAARFCSLAGIPCHLGKRDVAGLAECEGMGIEEAARTMRYEFFKEAMDSHRAQWVAVGHTLNDLGEDLLLRLVRGTGWPALAGMPGCAPSRRLLRPLLLTSRADVEEFLTSLGLDWVEDPSNNDEAYRRNRMRHDVLPRLMAENPNFTEAVSVLWKLARIDDDYWRKELAALDAAEVDEVAGDRVELPLARLAGHPRALRLRAYKYCLESLGPGQALSRTLFKLDEAVARGVKGKIFQFPGGKSVRLDRDCMVFFMDGD